MHFKMIRHGVRINRAAGFRQVIFNELPAVGRNRQSAENKDRLGVIGKVISGVT